MINLSLLHILMYYFTLMRDVTLPLPASKTKTMSLIAYSYYFLKEIIQILPSFRANFEVHQPQLLSLASSLLITHLSLTD